ncbi:hypothetical protein, partial [Mesorhizobium sp. L2C084A000]|uniref:hypothetical protein n=1 Tax=Mesorhizobium sp. L2C084A000 TaxID=1287116 RepID=UPI001AEC56EB
MAVSDPIPFFGPPEGGVFRLFATALVIKRLQQIPMGSWHCMRRCTALRKFVETLGATAPAIKPVATK